MKVNAITLRPGNIIEKDDKLWRVLKREEVHPGKGQSVLQAELRDIVNGTKDNVRFRTQETVEKVRLDQEKYQYLFEADDMYTFMHLQNYEQIALDTELIGEQVVFLQEAMEVEIESYEGKPLSVVFPSTVILKVEETEPVIKGQTVTSSFKPAIMDNGIRVMVPQHIDTGTMLVVKTEDSTYVERAK